MPILDLDLDIAKAMYDVNVWGVIRTTQVFSELVIAAEGTIVIIGSIAGVMPYVFGGPPRSHYDPLGLKLCSKAYLQGPITPPKQPFNPSQTPSA